MRSFLPALVLGGIAFAVLAPAAEADPGGVRVGVAVGVAAPHYGPYCAPGRGACVPYPYYRPYYRRAPYYCSPPYHYRTYPYRHAPRVYARYAYGHRRTYYGGPHGRAVRYRGVRR